MISTATCCCANVSITISGKPAINAVCHCDNCKKRTGSAFGLSIYVKNQQIIRISGDTEIYALNNNDVRQKRHFCKNCGTTLYWTVSSLADYTGIAGGCFDNNPLPEPNYTLSNESRLSWLQLPSYFKKHIEPDAIK
ncbi:hypothetical protein MNBD_GAMMA09-1648 [hydrothermal vent metagenome]|uniref:CENP-V/GFA domain-containing protein n=1 Tax=hydrothermal vent metagenome TaxID=652676 RepID=A0A3B0Y562_9ZZZZ